MTEEEAKPDPTIGAATSSSANGTKGPAGVAAPLEIIPWIPHNEMPEMKAPLEVPYCPKCGLTPDFCSYGPSWEECKPWVLENFPHFYPELAGLSIEDAKKRALEVAGSKKGNKLLPGGKLKKDQSPRVYVRKMTRSGRKCVTTVQGLDLFGVKLDAACKIFKKRFACGASVVASGSPNVPDEVDIQGDFEEELIEVLTENFPEIDEDKIEFLAGGTKKKGKK